MNEVIGAKFFDYIKNNNLSKVYFFEKNIEFLKKNLLMSFTWLKFKII